MPDRRPRISQAQTEQRMLAAAVDQVNASGLTVGLDHLSLEAVIAAADVSRAAAYRRWPTKELFLRDLLLELAGATTPRAAVPVAASWAAIRDVVLAEPARLPDVGHRWRVLGELIRQATDVDVERMHASPEWRTYLALHATFASLDDPDLRAGVQEALASAQRRFVEDMAASWRHVAGLLGYRLRLSDAGYELGAELVAANVRGLLVMAMADPSIVERRVEADPFGTGPAAWSLAALGCAALAASFLEPVPGLVWDAARTDALRAGLTTGAVTPAV